MPERESAPGSVCYSIVIPTCNRVDQLPRCLDAIAAALEQVDPALFEIVVADDSRGDETQRLIAERYPTVQWIGGPRRGPAANRNVGVARTQGRWIIFTDDDCVPEVGWLREYVRAFERQPDSHVFEGKTVADRQRLRFDEDSPVNTDGGYLWSCNMAIQRGLFDRLGGFCESFPYPAMEDVDFRLRLNECGERFPFVPDAVVCHPFRPTKGISFVVKSGESYLHLVTRHPYLVRDRRWIDFALNSARRARIVLHAGYAYRLRGFPYGLLWLAILTYFDFRSRIQPLSSSPEARW
jgi:GT2 family glycosyltransferase